MSDEVKQHERRAAPKKVAAPPAPVSAKPSTYYPTFAALTRNRTHATTRKVAGAVGAFILTFVTAGAASSYTTETPAAIPVASVVNAHITQTLNVSEIQIQATKTSVVAAESPALVSAETPLLPPPFDTYGEDTAANADDGLYGTDWESPTLTTDLGLPLTGTLRHVSSFGPRIAPCSTGCSSYHKGDDFTAAAGTPILSIASGVVLKTGTESGRGNYVVVGHNVRGQRVISLYEHMLNNDFPVKAGDTVSKGDKLGVVGSTGASTGNHLHLSIQVQLGDKNVYVSPQRWFAAHGINY